MSSSTKAASGTNQISGVCCPTTSPRYRFPESSESSESSELSEGGKEGTLCYHLSLRVTLHYYNMPHLKRIWLHSGRIGNREYSMHGVRFPLLHLTHSNFSSLPMAAQQPSTPSPPQSPNPIIFSQLSLKTALEKESCD